MEQDPYDALDPPGSGVSRKYYDAAGLRVAARSTTLGAGGFAEVPGPEPAVMVAAAGNGGGVVIGVRDATLQGGLSFGSVVLLGVVLLPLRGGRGMRRVVRGARTVGVAVVLLAGSSPVPWMLVPIGAGEAFAGGSGGGGGGTSSTVLEHYHQDRLGSTLLVTNWAGVVQQHVRYDAWGKVRGRWSVAGTAMAAPLAEREFTTYETEVETGLQYAGARFYDPEYGMFATLDPARQDANAYGYAGWNPVNATDPNGEIWWLLGPLLIGFAVGFTATFGGMLIGGASMKDAARAGAVAGAVAAVMSVLLQPVLGPMVDNVAKWFAGNVEKPALGYRLLAAGSFAAPSASLGAATGDWSGVIAFGLSAGILVAGSVKLAQGDSGGTLGADRTRLGNPIEGEDGTIGLLKACNGGSAAACGQLETRNVADLNAARAAITKADPYLLTDLPAVRWDGTIEFYQELSGTTDFWTGEITLSRGYPSRAALVESFAHELGHVKSGILGRALTNIQDAYFPVADSHWGLGRLHNAIYQRAELVRARYELGMGVGR